MKKGLKKIFSFFPECVQEFIGIIVDGAAEYHIKASQSGKQKYRSYIQLKRHQKNVRRFVALVFLVAASGFAGVLAGPIFFPQLAESEVYIPNGKGDILIGNVSRNQATVIFKTLDGANGNRPLATKSTVEFYEDENYSDLTRRIVGEDYAVTHMIPVDSLQENKIYYIRITAEDSASPAHTKTITSWGGMDNDPIKVFTTGELIPSCAFERQKSEEVKKEETPSQPAEQVVENGGLQNELEISNVTNESHLYSRSKVQTIISWTTNNPSTTAISYSEDRSGKKEDLALPAVMANKHAVVLTSLNPGKIYYFTVQSKDEKGNMVVSEEYSLRTPRAQENVLEKIANNFKELLLQVKPK